MHVRKVDISGFHSLSDTLIIWILDKHHSSVNGVIFSVRHCDHLTADLKASFSGCLADSDLAPSGRALLDSRQLVNWAHKHKENKIKLHSGFTLLTQY